MMTTFVGFVFDIKENEVEQLREYIGEFADKLRAVNYVAVLYRQKQDQMSSWYSKRKTRTDMFGYIDALYVDAKREVVVAEILIDGSPHYVTIVHSKTNIPLQSIKMMANRGDFGSRIQLKERIRIAANAYQE